MIAATHPTPNGLFPECKQSTQEFLQSIVFQVYPLENEALQSTHLFIERTYYLDK